MSFAHQEAGGDEVERDGEVKVLFVFELNYLLTILRKTNAVLHVYQQHQHLRDKHREHTSLKL